MPSLNVDINYHEHIKIKRLIGRLGKGADTIPVRLWCYTAKHYSVNGKLVGHSSDEIESAIGWWGAPGVCVSAMLDLGLLDCDEAGVYAVHDWMDHAGHLSAFKVRAKAGAKAKWDKVRNDASSNASSNAYSSAKKASKQCPSITDQCITDHPPPEADVEDDSSNLKEAYRLANELGIGHTLTPELMPQLSELIVDFGFDQARASCKVARQHNATGGRHMIRFARSNAARESNKPKQLSAALAQEDA